MSPANLHTGRLPVVIPDEDDAAFAAAAAAADADAAAGPAGVGRRRPARALAWAVHRAPYLIVAGCVLAALVVLGLRLPAASGSFSAALRHVSVARLRWLVVAIVTEALSFVAYGLAQRRLLRTGGQAPPRRLVGLLVFASSGLTCLLPGGMLPASGWLVEQYRRRGVDQRVAVWALVAGGFTATVAAFGLLLAGCGLAGIGPTWLLALSGVVLVVGSAGFVAAGHRLDRLEEVLARHGHRGRVYHFVHRLSASGADIGACRIGWLGGSEVFAYSAANWVLDALCLLAAFHAVGFALPGRSFLFAYTASQALGSVLPLPGGVGVVDGGLVGALTITGTPLGHAIVGVVAYRMLSYWLVTACATLTLAFLSHRWRDRSPVPASLPSDAGLLRRLGLPTFPARAGGRPGDRPGRVRARIPSARAHVDPNPALVSDPGPAGRDP